MEFKFDANQEYQIRAIESVTNLFEGQPRIEIELQFNFGGGLLPVVPNKMILDDETILKNLRRIQSDNGLVVDEALIPIKEMIETAKGQIVASFSNFSVEMETGTGKTYIYIRTALELFRRYGLRKFIVVVPSVAIREGVLKTLRVTKRHLLELYENVPYSYYAYDSANISQVRQFAISDGVEIMVMTIDSFNKASNVIRQHTDRLQGEMPVHLVQATRPILILDEPQNMESELRIKALSTLDPLFALRYSATHRNPYNVVYRLTPFEAYRQGLVKRIEVAGVEKVDDANQVFLQLDGITTRKKTLTAQLTIHRLMKNGTVKPKQVTVQPGDNLEPKTNRSEYSDFTVDEINASFGFLRFTNGVELKVGESRGSDKEAIFEAQIGYTIEEHFRKQDRLKESGIKVLSLFFIDRVENYAKEDGIIRKLFDRKFEDLKTKYQPWYDLAPEDVRAAYFAHRRTKSGQIVYEDSKTGEAKKDKEAYDLIMKDKEQLLSFEEPTSFIFSHSALREGWDNPNIFQICTLNQTVSEMKKRQEVGRGVRLAVNQNGERIRDEKVNILTVVANDSYERYVDSLQTEIVEDYGQEGLPPKPPNARKRKTAHMRKEYTLKPEFKALWDRIKCKTRYAVIIDTGRLIEEVITELDRADIRPPRLTITKAEVGVEFDEDLFFWRQMSRAKTVLDLAGRYPLPNLVELMVELLERTTPPICLTRCTLLEMFKRTTKQQSALDNPYEFATVAVRIIKEKLADQLIDGILYEKINDWYEMTQFELELRSWEDYLIPAQHSVYDQVVFESEVERRFVEDLERRDDVKLYLKLPTWFIVPTPIGEYNPDWAIVMEPRDEYGTPADDQLLYLIRETKSTTNLNELRPDEVRKIHCGEKHFEDALEVSYKVVTSARDLP